jgi:hypothetical protein
MRKFHLTEKFEEENYLIVGKEFNVLYHWRIRKTKNVETFDINFINKISTIIVFLLK